MTMTTTMMMMNAMPSQRGGRWLRGTMVVAGAVCGLLLLLLSLSAQPTQGYQPPNSTCDTRFQHDDVRCKCTCTFPSKSIPEGTHPSAACDIHETNYPAGEQKELCGRETCVRCANDKETRYEEQCSYVVVVGSSSDCWCENIMPHTSGPNVTKASASDCGLCSCTFEARSQSLVKAAVITVMLAAAVMVVVAIFYPRVPTSPAA